MRAGAVLLIASAASLALSACAGGSYGLQEGDANYDAVKKASDECKARGGHIQLKSGGDTTELGDYECKMDKGK
ncbi:MAG: hypothetical protein JSR86_03965 [Proteobacteria bacterium]|nr:hypothetical protein [Pseudomonadota bacterium]